MRRPIVKAGLVAITGLLVLASSLVGSEAAWAEPHARPTPGSSGHQIFRPAAGPVQSPVWLAQTKTTRDASELEMMFWRSIKDSDNPADFEAYLEAFPDGAFVPLARVRAGLASETGPEIEEVELQFRVRVNANVRDGPSADSQRVGGLKQGDLVMVTGRVVDQNWLRVSSDEGLKGFVFGELLEPVLGETVAAAESASPDSEPQSAPEPQAETDVAAFPTAPEVEEEPGAEVPGGPEPQVFLDCDFCPLMVRLPAGSFVMGNDLGHSSERPAHEVALRHEFAIGQYEITVGQWERCVAEGGCPQVTDIEGSAPDTPVRNVSWVDAQQFVKWLSTLTGRTYRLPTEAEWEYAARGGTRTLYWWGDEVGTANVACRKCGGNWTHDAPLVVGGFAANPFGLHDMNGSVAEWTEDCWQTSYANAPSDGSAIDGGNCRRRVLRGGSWRSSSPDYLTSSSRFYYDDDVRFIENGFRVATD